MPLTTIQKRELEFAIESAIMLDPELSNVDLARKIYRSESTLMEEFKESLLIDRLIWMIGRRKQSIAAANQLPLPGFESLPRRINSKDGKRTAIRHADLDQLKAYREVLVERQDSRLDALDRLIALVTEEQRRTRSRVTVADVMAAEQKKQDWKP